MVDQKISDLSGNAGNDDEAAGNLESREGAKQANTKQTCLTCLPPSSKSVTCAPPTVKVEKGEEGTREEKAKQRKGSEQKQQAQKARSERKLQWA